ncbi:MAG: acetyl-CoA C-acyltransferase FadI [Acidobacteriota bacterium]|nr:acetyl-CoA C-acyltransferase FadI [Acidobacteriota bacterium]MDQ2980558.1 acetyl-CoA C-acyltransferase FadI [Acidobacteriota bacterium]
MTQFAASRRRVAVVAGIRTPFARSGTSFEDVTAVELGGMAVKELVARYDVDGSAVDELIYGTVIPSVTRPNIAREVVFEAGLPMRIPASSVIMACASSNRAITDGAEKIALGLAHAVIAGGSECLSDVPILFSRQFAKRLVRLSRSKSIAARLKAFAGFRIGELAPNPPAIAEYTTELSMGQSAEKMAKENGISRAAQDEFALRSHQRAAAGWDIGVLGPETFPVPIPPKYAAMETRDNNIRRDSTLEQLAKLKPVFDREYGSVTAGNSSPLTDGASAVLLMSEQRARAEGRRPLAFIRSWAYSALDPSDQLLQGPAYAAPIALERAGLQLSDMGRVEMHEAFAAQVLSNLQAFASAAFAREKLNRAAPLGEIDPTILNLYGGSIAIGHPFAATGARIVTTLANELVRSGKQFGLLTVCAAGALGHAMVLENAG